MSKAGTIIAIIAVLVALVILILSFGVHDPSKFPPQANGTHTGYPVWHPPFPEGSDLQQKDGTILFSAMIMIIAGYLVLKWTNFDARTNKKLLTYFVDKDSNKTSTIIFDRLLAYSCLITALTAVFYYAIDLGKIWSIVGILHNANEVFILVALHQGGKITSSSFIAWLTFYVVFATALSLYLEWPFDAVWFKIQGLCPDYALVIQFIRLYLDTRKGYGDETHQQLLDPERPRRNHTSEEGTSEESASEQEQVDDRITVYFRSYYVLLLVLASIVHIFGNVINAIMIYWFDAYLMFSFSYCITYPLYAYFVYLDTHSVAPPPARKYIILPDTSTPKVILVTASSLFLSLLTIRISMLVTN